MLKTQRPRQSRVLFPPFIWTKLTSLTFKTQNFCCFHHKNTQHFFIKSFLFEDFYFKYKKYKVMLALQIIYF